MERVESPRRRQELTILTSYSESIFLLASKLSIGRKSVDLLPDPVGSGGYVLQCEWPRFQIPFEAVLTPVLDLLQSCGASHVGKFWSEPSPVFEVYFDSQASIQRMVASLESGRLREGMESIILPLAQRACGQTTNPDSVPEWNMDISLDLLQVLPCADTKDAIVHRVKSANIPTCAHLWNERKVFDVGALLRWYRNKPLGGIMGASGDIKLLDLVRELHEFVGWMQLGLHLGVPKHTLERIRQQCATYGEVMCKTEMLSTWLDGRVEQPTWAEVVSAVSRSGNKRVARKIATKYGLALAVLIEDTEMPSDALAPNSPLESPRMEMEETDSAIEDAETKLQIFSRKKRKLEDFLVETQRNSDIVQRYTEMLAKDKESLEQKLKEREKEIRSLQAQQLEYERKIRSLEVKLATAGAKAKQKLKDKLKVLNQEKTELVERIEAKEKEVSTLTKSISKLRLKRDRAKTELSVALNQLELKTSQLDEVQQQLQLIQEQRDKLLKQLEAQEKGVEEAVMRFADSERVQYETPLVAESRGEPTRPSGATLKEVLPPEFPSTNVKLQFRNWSRCSDMPHGMASAQAVLLNGKVYIGGGNTDSLKDEYVILVYSPEGDEWTQLPSCPVRSFAMASVNHQLVLAGGLERGRHDGSNKLVVWNNTSHSGWTNPYPPMPTAHVKASAIGHWHYLVVAGGWRYVEILDTSNSQWHTAESLPVGCELMTSAVLANTLYLMGGTAVSPMQVLAASLPSLVSEATSRFPIPTVSPLWVNLPNTPFKNSTASVLEYSLLAIGGQTDASWRACEVLRYDPMSGSWVKVGDMPVRRSHLSSVVLSHGALLVCGGLGVDGATVYSNQVYTCTVTI